MSSAAVERRGSPTFMSIKCNIQHAHGRKGYYDGIKVALIINKFGHLIDKLVGVINIPS